MMTLTTNQLLDLSHSIAGEELAKLQYPWQFLPSLKDFILQTGKLLEKNGYTEIAPNVWAEPSAIIAPSALINGPCIIGKGTEIRHCAFIRGSALIGDGCVVGNSVELKNSILFDGCQVPHFNYVGDSILGYKAHMGGASLTSNVKCDKTDIVIHGEEDIVTGLRKMGAIIGDHAEIGAGAVLNPGCIIGRNAVVYPNTCVRGVVPENHIYKEKDNIVPKNSL